MADTAGDKAVTAHLRHIRNEGKAEHTIKGRELTMKRLARALPVPLLDATADDLYAWRDGLTHLKGSTVACYASAVIAFYRWAAKQGLIPADPTTDLPVPPVRRRSPRPIPEADLMLALAHTTPAMRVRQAMVLGGWAGLRSCEIAGLRVENLRLRDTPPVVIVSRESSKGAHERVVELSPFVVAEMEAAKLPSHGLAFPAANGGQLSANFLCHQVNDHLHACGTASTFHCLRHRFASQLYQATHDLRLVQEMLGHASQSTTAGYAAFSRRGATHAVAALPVPGDSAEEPAA